MAARDDIVIRISPSNGVYVTQFGVKFKLLLLQPLLIQVVKCWKSVLMSLVPTK